MKKHDDHGNSYKENHLIVVCLQYLKFSPLLLGGGAWSYVDRHGAREIA